MTRFILRRLGLLLLTMVIVSVAVFAITEIAPGNIARNTLGVFITPEQEVSFNAQIGLHQPIYIRYLSWLIGSDWRAEYFVRMPLERISDTGEAEFWEWWAKEPDGTLIRWRVQGNDLIAIRRQPDGTKVESVENDRWVRDPATGEEVFWGVDQANHGAKWVRGSGLEQWTLTVAAWMSVPGAPTEYIPLQTGILRGDPGKSTLTGKPVADTLFRRLRNSLLLAGIAFAVIMPLALLLGLIAGLNAGKPLDRALSVAGLITTVTPEFATGIFLILIFAIWLKWVPGATVFISERTILDNPEQLILPVATLTLIEVGYVLRITRASMVDVMRTAYIRTAFLKGLPRWQVVFRHAVRNALMAPITVIMLHVNWLLGGIVVVEVIFGYPGLGKYLLDSALFKDVFAIEAGAMVLVLLAVGTQLVADVIYTFLNPRIRYA